MLPTYHHHPSISLPFHQPARETLSLFFLLLVSFSPFHGSVKNTFIEAPLARSDPTKKVYVVSDAT